TTIPRNVRVAEAPSHGVPVGAYDKFSRGARAYKEFTKEVEERTK
ncbi:MAG: ParA family protein, partial [Exiguobacterium sp.]|nr:ParA family protein [Exiguobacterium sp.]